MWTSDGEETSRNLRFFHIMFLYLDIEHYFRLMFSLMKDHNFSLTEMEDLIPWEREIYIILLREWIKEENERQRRQNSSTSFSKPSMPRMPSVPRR